MEPKETRTDVMESIPQEPPNLDHFTSVDGAHRENRSGELVTMDFLSMLKIQYRILWVKDLAIITAIAGA